MSTPKINLGANAVTMTATIRKFVLSCIVVAGFAVPAASQAACVTSLSSLNGWFSLLVKGSTTASVPAAKYLAGALLFDGAGGISGTHVYAGGGVVTGATGSYVINTDCTLTVMLTLGSTGVQTYTVAVTQDNEAVGIETDANAVAQIDLQAQYATVTKTLNFTSSSLNGTFAANCVGPATLSSDTNVVTFMNGSLKGTDPFNNDGTFVVANNPYSGSYTVNSDGTFSGQLTVGGTGFAFYGVLSSSDAKVQYIYANLNNGAATAAFASCTGKSAAAIAF